MTAEVIERAEAVDRREPGPTADHARSAVKGLFGHDALYMGLWAIQLVLASLLTPVTTRLLGSREYGTVAAAIAVLQVMVAIAGFSLFTAVQRAYERDGEEAARRIVTLAINVALLVFAVSYATGELWCPLVGLGHFPVVIRYALAWAMLSAITNAGLSHLRSCNRLGQFAAVSIAQSVVAEAVALGLVVLVHRTASEYLLGQMLLQVVAVGLVIVFVRPRRLHATDGRLMRETLVYGATLVPAVLSSFVLDASDRLVVHADLGATALARYVVARNIGGFAIILLAVLNAIWMPRLFALKDRAVQREVLAASRDGIYALVLSAMLILTMASPLLLWLWVPPSYHPGGLLLVTALVAAASLPMAGAQSQTQVLLVGERTAPVAIGTMVAAVLNLALNLALVPVLGIDGSALITLGCYGVQLAILQHYAMRTIRLRRPSPRLLGLAVVGVGIALGSAGLPLDGPAIALRVLIASAAATLFGVQLISMVLPGRIRIVDQYAGWLAKDRRPPIPGGGTMSLVATADTAGSGSPDEEPASFGAGSGALGTDPDVGARIAARARRIAGERIAAALDGPVAVPTAGHTPSVYGGEPLKISEAAAGAAAALLDVAVVYAAADELGIKAEDALAHPAVDRARELLGQNGDFEPADAGSSDEDPRPAPNSAAEPDRAVNADNRASRSAAEPDRAVKADAGGSRSRRRRERVLLLDAVHVSGVETLEPDDHDIELRLSRVGIDVRRPSSDETIGRLSWNEIRSVALQRPRAAARGRRRPALFVAETDYGDEVTFELTGVSDEDITEHLNPMIARHCAGHFAPDAG